MQLSRVKSIWETLHPKHTKKRAANRHYALPAGRTRRNASQGRDGGTGVAVCASSRCVFLAAAFGVGNSVRRLAPGPGLFVINQTKPPFTTHKHKHRTKSNQVLAMAMLSRRALRRRLRFRTDRRALGRDARDCGASRRIPKSGTEGSAHKKKKKTARSLESRKQATHDTCSHSQYGHRHPRWHTSVVLPPRVTR